MKKNVLHIGIDVDEKMFHAGGISLETGEVLEFKTKATFGALIKKLSKFQAEGYELKVCYEATYIGYSLCRDLRAKFIDCEIIAPSLIPEKPGNRVKTDRIDAMKLAEYYAKGLLTKIYVPDKEDEQVRDLIRSRGFLVKERKKMKKHILSICKRYRLNYREETKKINYWTVTHIDWLTGKIKKMSGYIKTTLEILLYQLDKLTEGISEYDRIIKKISEEERYKRKKEALNCYRGLDTLSSMKIITEIGDIKRFAHPKCVTSYVGLDITEYSSGGKEKKYGITKMGNKWIRTTVIEACQNVFSMPRLSKRLRAARKDQELKVIDIAERCEKRLRKKAIKMRCAGKHTNKIKAACGREMLGFIWETLQFVT